MNDHMKDYPSFQTTSCKGHIYTSKNFQAERGIVCLHSAVPFISGLSAARIPLHVIWHQFERSSGQGPFTA